MRTISSTILDQIDNAVAIPRSLYHLELQDKSTGATNHVYLTNHEANLTFGGIEYQSYKAKHSPIKTYLKNQTDNCNITMDNVDRGFSSYFAYNEFAGQNADTWKIFLDSSLNPIGTAANGDYIKQFKGMMDRPKVTEESCEVRVVNIFNREQSYTPWRRFSAKCNWDFCGLECRYNGGNDKARGTATHAGSTTTLRDTGLGTFATDYWKGASLKILSGMNKGEVRYISGYNATTKTFTVESAFPLATDTTSKYIVECDKSKSTCKGYVATGAWSGNEGNFDGFNEQLMVGYNPNGHVITRGTLGGGGSFDLSFVRDPASPSAIKQVDTGGGFIPFVYGEGVIDGRMIAYADKGTSFFHSQTRIYGFCSGKIDSIKECIVNGTKVDRAVATAYQERLGLPAQSLDKDDYYTPLGTLWCFPVDKVFYWPHTVYIGINSVSGDGRDIQISGSYTDGYFKNVFTEDQNDSVSAVVKGLKVQKYDADGTVQDAPNDVPVWSQNPVWCLLDFLINRASKKLDTAYINFAYAKAAADLCDSLGYKINLVIKEQKKDTEIIESMLAACRGYITYSTGKMEINLERTWVHPTSADSMPAHLFDDTSNPAWTATTKKYLGDVVRKTVDNGYRYKCTVLGTTGGSEPTWPTTIGNTVVDGSVTWACIEIADNIGVGSFSYWQEDVNDVPNRIIVKYIDQEIRENMALISGLLSAASTTIPYGDLKGSLAASGTIYVSGEAITYTGNSGTQLTGCSARIKDYPSGYAIFQGAQTFPELTAIYNDYDNQDRVKRVIEKEIDGSAIPTYKQAYNIAEYHGRKAVEGNLKCSFKGLMDSLKLTVGDVVKITHALPGWVDAQFRVTEAAESEDEEVEYTCEFYDSSFYAESDLLPSVSLGTTLPNPYAVPGHVTGLSLSEDSYINKDGTYVPTLNLTYTLPSGDATIFWDRAKVQISVNGGNYDAGVEDLSRGTGFTIDGKGRFKTGDTVTVRVISISSNKISADATTAPTLSNKIDALIVTPSAPRGLSIEGNPNPNNTQWDGLRFALTWWKASQTGGAGGEGSLGAGGFTDPYWNGDEYELWVGGSCIDKGITKEARYDYVYGDGYLDFLDDKIAAANGTVTFKIRRVSLNQPSEWATITITQQAPATPAGLASDFTGRNLIITWTKATETDFNYYELILNGVTKKLTDPFYTYTVEENIKDNLSADPSITYSLKAYDIYGNASSALTGTFTNSVPSSPPVITATQWMDSVQFEWTKSSETDISHYRYRSKIDAGAWSSWITTTRNSVMLFAEASQVIYVEVISVDVFGQELATAATANGTAQGLNIAASDINDFAITASKIFTKIPIISGDTWTDNSPSAGRVAWNAHTLYYNGAAYAITASDTDLKYIYWTGGTTYTASDTNPTLTDGQFIIATNITGAHDLAWNAIANQVIGSAYIQSLAVQDAHIETLTVSKLTAGTITSKAVTLAVADGTGDTKIQAGKTDFGDNTAGFILGIDDSDSDKVKLEIGDATKYLKWDGATLSIRGSLNADDIVAGSIRGIGVYGSTHATKGSYLTATCAASDATLYVKDTTDFPSSGSGWIIDSANDRDAISWTGKTATTLTGCSGVLAHTVSASNVPVVVLAIKAMVIADVVNEMRFFGDRGDGTIEELASIGRKSSGGDYIIASFGSSASTAVAVLGSSSNNIGINGSSSSGIGVRGESSSSYGVVGTTTSGYGVYGISYDNYGVVGLSTSNVGLFGTSTTGLPLRLNPATAAPSNNVADGGVYYNSTDNKFYGRANGVWVAFH